MTDLEKINKRILNLNEELKVKKKEKQRKLKEKKKNKEIAERIKKIKENKLKRKKRAVHLFILGNILKSCELDNLDEETLIGYFLSFNKINPLKIDRYKIIGKQILAEKEIRRKEKIEKLKNHFYENTGQERSFTKKEYSRMIKIGAIFEMTGIDNVDLAVLFGFVQDFKIKSNAEKNNFYLDGKLFKIEREKDK